MRRLEIILLVAGRELRERGLTPAYLILGGAVPVLVSAVLLLVIETNAAEIAAELADDPSSGSGANGQELELAYPVVMLPLMLASGLASGFLAGAIIEEKSSRVIEVLLATMQPRQLLAGKMLGIGLLVLAPVALVTASAVAGLLFTELSDLLPGLTAGAVPLLALWLLLGYSLFVVLSAGLASLASRPEENSWYAIAVFFLILGFQAGAYVVSAPDSGFAVATSYVPFTAPFVVPTRFLAGSISAGGHLVAATLMVVVTAVLSRAAARIYSGAILHLRGRARIADAYRSAEL